MVNSELLTRCGDRFPTDRAVANS